MITYKNLGRNGGLGNQLWQIASTIGLAHRSGEVAGFPFWRYQSYFSVPSVLFPDLIASESRDLGLDYLQDLRHLNGVEQRIREYFKPTPEVWLRLVRRFRDVLGLPNKTGVHVRRGDYLLHSDLFPPLPLDYYVEAMALTPGPYLVFSDDTQWCRENLPGDCVFLEHNRDYEDLFLMTACDALITANSTFSWWAAWLADNRAIYPRQWGTGFGYEAETTVIPPGSIVLDVGTSVDQRTNHAVG